MNNAVAQALQAAKNFESRGMRDAAEKTLAALIAKHPACAPALFRLGVYAQRRGDLAGAADYFEKTLALEPGNPQTLLLLCTLRMETGDKAAAMELAERLRKKSPTPPLLTHLGVLLRQSGETQAALEYLDHAVRLDPHFVPAYYAMMEVRDFEAGSPHIARLMQIQEKSANLSVEDRIKLEFLLGGICRVRGETDNAFAHYAAGQGLRESAHPYDIGVFESYVDSIIRLFDKAAVEKFHSRRDAPDAKPIFIVGMPRSGSTLVEQILASHPGVAGISEANYFPSCVPVYPNTEVPEYPAPAQPGITRKLMDELSPAMLDGIGRKYLSLTAQAVAGGKRTADKMLFNFLWLGLIRIVFPKAAIVHCTRDPRDIGLSLWQINFFPAACTGRRTSARSGVTILPIKS